MNLNFNEFIELSQFFYNNTKLLSGNTTLAMTIHIQFTTRSQTRLYSGNINNLYDTMFLKNTVNIEMSSFKHIKQAMDLNRWPT